MEEPIVGWMRAILGRALQTRGAGFGLLVVAFVLFVALSADVIAPYNPNQPQPAGVLTAPALAHRLGDRGSARSGQPRRHLLAPQGLQDGV